MSLPRAHPWWTGACISALGAAVLATWAAWHITSAHVAFTLSGPATIVWNWAYEWGLKPGDWSWGLWLGPLVGEWVAIWLGGLAFLRSNSEPRTRRIGAVAFFLVYAGIGFFHGAWLLGAMIGPRRLAG